MICKISIKVSKIKIQGKERKVLIACDDIIADMYSIKKRKLIFAEVFIRGRKLNILIAFIR